MWARQGIPHFQVLTHLTHRDSQTGRFLLPDSKPVRAWCWRLDKPVPLSVTEPASFSGVPDSTLAITYRQTGQVLGCFNLLQPISRSTEWSKWLPAWYRYQVPLLPGSICLAYVVGRNACDVSGFSDSRTRASRKPDWQLHLPLKFHQTVIKADSSLANWCLEKLLLLL